jgi:hypothetical protein
VCRGLPSVCYPTLIEKALQDGVQSPATKTRTLHEVVAVVLACGVVQENRCDTADGVRIPHGSYSICADYYLHVIPIDNTTHSAKRQTPRQLKLPRRCLFYASGSAHYIPTNVMAVGAVTGIVTGIALRYAASLLRPATGRGQCGDSNPMARAYVLPTSGESRLHW